MATRDGGLITYRFEGFKELEARISAFPQRFRRNAMRGGMRAGLKVLVQGARKRVPVKSGALKKTIRSSSQSFNEGALIIGRVSVGGAVRAGKLKGKATWYAHIIERGAKAHVIKPRRSEALAFGGRFVREVKHPGIRGRFFMAQTASQDGPKAERAYVAYVENRARTYLDPK